MALLFVTQHYYPNKGGMAESCDRLIRNFRANNIVVHVIHFTNRRQKFKTETVVNGTYTALPVNNSEEFTLNLGQQFIENFSFLKDIKYIIAYGGYLPLMLCPIISKYYNLDLVTLIRGNDFDASIFSKKREVLLYALNQSKYIFTVTSEKQQKITNLTNHKNTIFAQNGIDCKFWEVSKSMLPKIKALKQCSQEKKCLVIIGQLKEKKGIVEFAQALSRFSFKDDYQLWLVGDVEETSKEKIETLGVDVQYFDFAPKNILLQFYQAADAIVIPSFYDGMPNVLLEAGASKKLVLASNVGGIKDVIDDNINGLLFNPLKTTDVLEVLLKMHNLSSKAKEKLAQNLFNKIETNYTETNEIKTYLNILQL